MPLPSPVIILVEPQLGENIGATARVMQNFGLNELRIVNPRDGWPNAQAEAMAVGAIEIVKQAKVTATLEEALADIQHVYAASARQRYMVKPVLTSHEWGADSQLRGRSALMFGPERTGLTNDHIALANHIVTIPVNPAFASLNLAQSVAILAYEWFSAQENLPMLDTTPDIPPAATHNEIMGLFTHLETALERHNFFKTEDKKPGMINSIRNIFKRMVLTSQDIKTLRGIIRSLSER